MIGGEILSLTVVLTTGISSILMMAKVLTFSSFLFSAPDILMSFLVLFLYTLPTVVKFTLPISLVLASAVTSIRMSSDRELEAWMSCGTNIFRMCRAPFFFGIASSLLCLVSALYFEPYTNRMFEHFKWLEGHRLVEAFINNGLKEKSFIYNLKELSTQSPVSNSEISMYFNKITPDKKNMEDDSILNDYISHNVIGPKNIIELSYKYCPNLKSIIHFSSLYGKKSPYHPLYGEKKKSLSYCISKYAMEGLTNYYATLLAPKKIRINNIRVGGVKSKQPKKFIISFLKKTPINKMVDINDIANAVDFLCSEKSKYIVGENLSLDGGYNLW